MKRLSTLIALFLVSFGLLAQTNPMEVTLVSLGRGNSQEEAISTALANVVEQTLGTVISVDGKGLYNEKKEGVFRLPIYNKPTSELWKKAIESSGIIAKSEVLLSITLPNKTNMVSVKATVVLDNIVMFLNSHGVHAEWMGTSFTLPTRIRDLKGRNEKLSLTDISELYLESISCFIFDLELIPDSMPKQMVINNVPGYLFLNTVKIYQNEYSDFYYRLILSTLGNLSLTEQEVAAYKESGVPYSYMSILYFATDEKGDYYFNHYDKKLRYYLRCDENSLQEFIKSALGGVVMDAFLRMKIDVEATGSYDNLRFYYETDPWMFVRKNLGSWLMYSEYNSFSGSEIRTNIPLCHDVFYNFIYDYDYNSKRVDTSNICIPFFSKFPMENPNEKRLITSIRVPYFIMESDMKNVMGFTVFDRQVKK